MKADFKCTRCQRTDEIEIDAKDKQICCGYHMRRVWTAPVIRFTGSGFYSTDYKRGKK